MLRGKLLLGTMPLVGIVLTIGIVATVLLLKLGEAIDVILRENYASVVACQNIKEAAGDLDLLLFKSLPGSDKELDSQVSHNIEEIDRNLQIELNNITLPHEKELAERLRDEFRSFEQREKNFYTQPAGSPERTLNYQTQLNSIIDQLKKTAETIKVINQQNMVESNEKARKLGKDSARWMVAAMILAIGTGFAATWLVSRAILRPIMALIESSRELGAGNWDQVVMVKSQDELGELANTFNHMAGRLRAFRQSTTETIWRAQQTTQAALAAFPDPILVYSPSGEIELKNVAAERYLSGRPEDSPIPESISRLVDEVFRGGKDHLPTSFDQATAISLSNDERFYLPRVLAMRDELSALTGVVVVLQDVTRFRVADELKSNLIATVSHELKTPLTSIQMAVYLLLEERIGHLSSKQLELLVSARQNSERLLQMIDDLLDLAKFEEGTSSLRFEAADPKHLLTQAAEGCSTTCKDNGIHLEIVAEERLPKVRVGIQEIGHVFSNLLSNAIKYSPLGGTIQLKAARVGDNEVRFAVVDEGPGIPSQFYKRIFEKFFRMGDDKQGVGLGLAIAREIVLAHGGRIDVKSDPDRGSEFFFFLPVANNTNPNPTYV